MKEIHKIYIYELWQDDIEVDHDWVNDKPIMGSLMVDMTFVPEPSDNICIGARDADGNYWQYDSHEAYYAEDYFRSTYDRHKLRIVSRVKEVDLS
jgi:hypothetical protein